jgi:hypothetical protein
MKKIAIVSMIKNECDIIELFLKINFRIADYIYIIDHQSNDGTTQLIQEFQRENPNLHIIDWADNEFRQAAAISYVAQHIAKLEIVDYILPLDADEFISFSDNLYVLDYLENSLSKNDFGIIPWHTYCPINDDFFKAKAPLNEIFRKRLNDPIPHFKVILGNEFAKNCLLAEGNHFAYNDNIKSLPVGLNLSIQHVPIRSTEQIIQKSLFGSYALSQKKNRFSNEGYHWDLMSDEIREKNYKLSFEDINKFSLYYAVERGTVFDTSLDLDGPKIGLDSDEIILKDFAHPNIVRAYDFLTLNLIKKIKSLNQ